MTTNLGRSSSRTRWNSYHSPDRSPARPARRPATDTSWQGNPPQTTSTARRFPDPTSRTSSYRLTSGQCRARTARHAGSISTCQAHSIPAAVNPMSKPPTPENSEPKVSVTASPARATRAPARRCTPTRAWRGAAERRPHRPPCPAPSGACSRARPSGRGRPVAQRRRSRRRPPPAQPGVLGNPPAHGAAAHGGVCAVVSEQRPAPQVPEHGPVAARMARRGHGVTEYTTEPAGRRTMRRSSRPGCACSRSRAYSSASARV